MKKILALCMAACLLLSGCTSLFDGSYVSTMPHQEQGNLPGSLNSQVSNYDELLTVLIAMTERGSKNGVIYVQTYDPGQVGPDLEEATKNVLVKSPIAAYAVENITWELGTNSGQRAVAVNISYYHERGEILNIRRVSDPSQAIELLYKELGESSAGIVMYLEDYRTVDYAQVVEKYAFDNPQTVMETPQVSVSIYPKSGESRVIELKFTYQNNRETLRVMKSQVYPVYLSLKHSVDVNAAEQEKFLQLYSFLMDRGFGEYTIETSNTPAYSLLLQGAGDSKAFATMYASICRQASLECMVITGTRNAEPWYWNLVKVDGSYYHLDLLRSHEQECFQLQTDRQMTGYVWDYTAVPATPEETKPSIPENTEPPAPTGSQPQPTQKDPL